MVNFFIGRPIFATVLALLMLLIGGICIFVLPIAQYPQISPPQVQVTTTYTGADANTVAETVTTPIEQQINGVKGMIYFSSDSTSNGISTIVATFDVGYSQDIGAVDIQNRVETAQAVLPPEVKQFGVTIKKTSTDMVCVVNLVSADGKYDSTYLDNYAQIYVLDSLKRVTGVSDVSVFGRKYAMRIWLDPDRMASQFMSPEEVITRIQSENRQAAAGKIGAQPVPAGQAFKEYPILTKGRLTTVKEFEEIVIRRHDDGSFVRLGDVARVELDSENYDTAGWVNGKPAGTLPVYQYSDANGLDIVKQVRESMDHLAKSFPPGLEYQINYDTTKYVRENIEEVEHTLVEAFLLVLIVVFVFLQGFRATIIPMLAIPVALVATFALMAAFGFSINTLTLCGLILAIGLVVDDAIIVVENVEKFLERGDQPLEAVRAAMAEITAPIVTITLVLAAVFVPVAFIPGLTGRLYNQFAMTIVFSFVFSAINSLTFSPAMSRLFLRPKHGETKFFFFRWFNSAMRWLENSYDSFLDFTAHHWWTIVIPSIGLLALTGWMLVERPKAFIPTEDQGYLIASIQTPDGTGKEATAAIAKTVGELARDLSPASGFALELIATARDKGSLPSTGKGLVVVADIEHVLHFRIFDNDGKILVDTDEKKLEDEKSKVEFLRKQLASAWPPHKLTESESAGFVASVASIVGLNPVNSVLVLEGFNVLNSTNQTNSATGFIVLDEWSKRNQPGLRAGALAAQLQRKIAAKVRGAVALVLQPPPIRGLSQTGGFEFMIEDREGRGTEALAKVTDSFLNEARLLKDNQPVHPELGPMFTPFSAQVPQLRFDLDRVKAERLDVSVADVFTTLQTNLGGFYVNDFNLYGKVWKVILQAEGKFRTRPSDITNLYVLNRKKKKVPLSALGDFKYALGAIDVPHYNMYTSAKVTGQPAPGFSSGQAIAAMERVADIVLPEGFSYEWTGTTFQEQKTGNVAVYIFSLSILCVFLFMAALYESWVRPLVIILTVPLAMFGAVIGLWLFNMPLDVFGQIGLVMLIGLETKNAILIVEFGVELQKKHGTNIIDSAKEASRQRLRPILMTSFAFVMGVLPMARATGAGAYSRNSLGIVIVFGILVSTVLGRFVIPIYYVLGERLIKATGGGIERAVADETSTEPSSPKEQHDHE